MMQTVELSPAMALLADAARLLRTVPSVGAFTTHLSIAALFAAREPIADWLESWIDVDIDEDGPAPEDFRHAMRIARAVLGPEGTR